MNGRADRYKCRACGFEWGGYERPPPKANCPKCLGAMMRHLTHSESDLIDAGFIPRRFNR